MSPALFLRAVAVELGQGDGGGCHAGRAGFTYPFEIPQVFGAGKIRELAAEGDDLVIRLGPVECGPAIGSEQGVISRSLVGKLRLLVMVWRLRVLRVRRLLGVLELVLGILL